jgi:hypothetical protein
MIGDKAIRLGEDLPDHYRKMARAICHFSSDARSYCGAMFWIIHEERTADPSRAGKQAAELNRILLREHTYDADVYVHRKTYELKD